MRSELELQRGPWSTCYALSAQQPIEQALKLMCLEPLSCCNVATLQQLVALGHVSSELALTCLVLHNIIAEGKSCSYHNRIKPGCNKDKLKQPSRDQRSPLQRLG